MRNIIIAVVAVLALVVAGVGGTVAGWSDSEISHDNYIETGSLDLKVNGEDDLPWGAGVPTKVQCDCMIPCCENCWSDVIDLWNAGQCCSGEAFIHFKEFCCYDILQEHTGTVPEPELVCEGGGWVDQVYVEPWGGECDLPRHVDVTVWECNEDGTILGEMLIDALKLADLESLQISLGVLEPCEPMYIIMLFHLQQIEDPDWPGDAKFKDWPTNCLMKDGLMFNIEFDLIQVPKEA